MLFQYTMVKVTFELSEVEIKMLAHCIEKALHLKAMSKKEKQTAMIILKQLSKNYLNPSI